MIIVMQSGFVCEIMNHWWGFLAIGLVVGYLLRVLFSGKRSGSGPRKEKSRVNATPASGNGAIEIHVGNLNYDMTEDQLRAEFERFGTVNSARIISHRQSRRSKGFGFVEMQNRKEADQAIKTLNNKEIMGRKIRLNEARGKVRDED